MWRVPALAALAPILAACAALSSTPQVVPTRAADFKPSEIRQPIVFVQMSFGPGEYTDEERKSMPQEYEGALLEELNAQAVLTREVRVSIAPRNAKRDSGPALARARELGADHAIFVEVRVIRGPLQFCQGTRRQFQALATLWGQTAEVVRASDGVVRLRIAPGPTMAVFDLDADCENPRESRRRTTTEALAESVKRLLRRLLGS